ncbi:MAG: NHL repeat-containing protein, partial [Atribacterota bacterium]|nr:NHL repeat-containing protein [Atribacterota bacterium]
MLITRGDNPKRFEADLRESDPSLTEENTIVGGYPAVLIQTAQEGRNLFFVFIRSNIPLAFLFTLVQSGEKEVREILRSVSIGDVPYILTKLLGMETLDFPKGVACDGEGNIYVASAKHQIVVFNVYGEIVRTIGEEGTNPGQLFYPSGIAISPEGYLYIADAMNRIQKFDRGGNFLELLAEGLREPSGLACDGEGNVYVVETGASQVTKFNREGKQILIFGGPEEFAFSDSFTGIVVSKNGEVFVSDPGHNRILVFDASGKVLRSIYRVPQAKGIYLLNGDFPHEPPRFIPTGLAVDAQGHLYAADKSSSSLFRFGKEGNLEVVWKLLEGHSFSFPENTLGSITGIALDSSGVVYAARSVTPYALFGFSPTTHEAPPPLRVVDIHAVPPLPKKDSIEGEEELVKEEKPVPSESPISEKTPTQTMFPGEEISATEKQRAGEEDSEVPLPTVTIPPGGETTVV